jgi:predicted lipid-binding transport protein (Tim44 family)
VNIMRATFDKLISWTGILLAVVLLVAGGLLTWASTFIGNQVHDQLAQQHVTMPTSQQYGELPAADKAALAPFAGQKLTTGPQAQAYADHYINAHLQGVADGQTYSEVSAQNIAQCSDPKAAATEACQTLAGQKATLFQGETLRGLLLYGYAFATMGTIAGFAAIASFVGAALLFALAGIGFWHSRRANYVTAEARPVGAQV